MADDDTTTYTADVVCVRDDDHVLLIERDWPPFKGAWALPGGWVDEGETNLAAAVRELAEETGVRVATGDLREIGVWGEPGRDPRGLFVTTAYLAVVPSGTVARAGDDARDARWWPLDALPDLAFDHTRILLTAQEELRTRTTTIPTPDAGAASATNPVPSRGPGTVEDEPDVRIVSFGYGHGPAPTADLTYDLRRRFRNPHADPAMRELTGLDRAVYDHVLATPGIDRVARSAADLAADLRLGLGAGPITVATGCVGGRHRSVALACRIAEVLTDYGALVDLVHRDVHRPLLADRHHGDVEPNR
ncbi:NUDIX domain-containing protein [Embleya sp. NPDC056575]|uniref:RapZ C-terminal domain-containing protein n=1 Tax=unclassified Embleya TaxID=2699296 RepID=UPI0036BA7457